MNSHKRSNLLNNDFYDQVNAWGDKLFDNLETFERLDIGQGKAGIALFFLYKFLTFKQRADLRIFYNVLEKIVSGIDSIIPHFIVVQLTEIAILLHQYRDHISREFDIYDIANDIDIVLNSYTHKLIEKGNLDGYVGAGYPAFYFLLKNGVSEPSMAYLSALDNKKITDDGGNFRLSLNGSEEVQLGLTHGIAFVNIFLFQCVTKEVSTPLVKRLLKGFTAYLLDQKQDYAKYGSYFPALAGQEKFCQSNLCYGDLGIILSLIRSGTALKNQKTLDFAMESLKIINTGFHKQAAALKSDNILYGKTGLYLMYQHLSQITDAAFLHNARKDWAQISSAALLKKIKTRKTKNETLQSDTNSLSFAEGLTGEFIIQMAGMIGDWRFKQLFFLC